MPSIDPNGLTFRESYRLLTGSIVPRPIGWFTSVDPETGVVNLAPFSFFTGCSVLPPMICFASASRDGTDKDTVRNIRRTREFVANIVTEELGEPMVLTSLEFPPGVSEVEKAGLSLMPSTVVQVPRVKESPIHFECRLHSILQLGNSPHSLVIGEVVMFHIADGVYDDGRIEHGTLRALGRLAGEAYVTTQDVVRIPRPAMPLEEAGH